MITREDIKELLVEEVGKKLQEDIDNYKKEISEVKNMDELVLRENDIIEEMKKYDEYLRNTKYFLSNGVDYNGVFFNKIDIKDKIIAFINKNEVEFQYTEGLYQLVNIWKNIMNTQYLDYYKYDSTLRVLGQLKYKGYKEWTDILAINKYFSKAHDEYSKDTSYSIYLAQLHNAILDQMKSLDENDEQNDEQKTLTDIPDSTKNKKK